MGSSIVDYLTDGSLPALCEVLGTLAGRRVVVRGADGSVIEPAPPPGCWEVRPGDGLGAEVSVPIVVGGRAIGRIEVVSDAGRGLEAGERGRLERLLRLVASTVSEVCGHEVELRSRLREIGVLYRLTALLARAEDLDAVLHSGLDSALEALDLDAGSIVLFAEGSDGQLSADERDLVLKASRSLSREWLESPVPLSQDRVFDRLALSGEVVVVEDLVSDPRVLLPEMVRSEGLSGAIHAGLVFQDRPIGVIRLYSRRPRSFGPEDARLVRSIGQQLAVAVQQARLLRVQAEDERIQRQLALASDVQRRMLPRSLPAVPPLEVAASWTPSLELSGDFYDVMGPEESGGRLGVVVGDVVGKGIAAALLMSLARGSLRAHCRGDASVAEAVGRVNRDLCRDMLEGEFVTMWVGLIDPETLEVEYCCAGHEAALVSRVGAGVERLAGGGPLLGVEPGWSYTAQRHRLSPGDLLVIYTDGLIDAVNFEGERLGRRRVVEAVERAAKAGSAVEALGSILRDVRQFTGLATRPDDQTVVVVRVAE